MKEDQLEIEAIPNAVGVSRPENDDLENVEDDVLKSAQVPSRYF